MMTDTVSAPRAKAGDVSLSSIEARVSRLLGQAKDEIIISGLSHVLQDIATLRVTMDGLTEGNKRAVPRFHENALVKIIRSGGEELYASIVDISTGGAMLEADMDLPIDEQLDVVLPELTEKVSARVLASRDCFVRLVFNRLPTHMIIAFVKHIDRHLACA